MNSLKGTVAFYATYGQQPAHSPPTVSVLAGLFVCAAPLIRQRFCRTMGDMDEELQQRHKPLSPLDRPRELIVACPPMRSNVNLSRIVRAASCCGVRRLICCGNARVIPEIARETGGAIAIEVHRSLPPILKKLRQENYTLVALEQTPSSQSIFEFRFPYQTVLIVGNERLGVEEEVLRMTDHLLEIPVYGLPYAHNAATATAMALYEYCRQYPRG